MVGQCKCPLHDRGSSVHSHVPSRVYVWKYVSRRWTSRGGAANGPASACGCRRGSDTRAVPFTAAYAQVRIDTTGRPRGRPRGRPPPPDGAQVGFEQPSWPPPTHAVVAATHCQGHARGGRVCTCHGHACTESVWGSQHRRSHQRKRNSGNCELCCGRGGPGDGPRALYSPAAPSGL